MREIKFRVWCENDDYPKGHMYNLDDDENDFLLNFNGDILRKEGDNPYWARINCQNIILEQFTGLKDKNGVEIYEGDICSAEDTDSNPPDYNFIGVVKFDNGAFELKPKDNLKPTIWCPYWTTSNEADVEVIGNIHENPELLA